MKYSRQREIVTNVIKNSFDHPTVDQVYEKVKKEDSNISLATVYRNLNLLVENGFVKKLSFVDGADHFEPIGKEHHHFVCKQCGKIIDLNINAQFASMDKLIEENFKSKVHSHDLIVYGICNNCLNN
ncbi:MAG: transcriptional repressor [Eubacteriales bacterium]|nr:transcriptional repressor [Eubacteriales bacterium]